MLDWLDSLPMEMAITPPKGVVLCGPLTLFVDCDSIWPESEEEFVEIHSPPTPMESWNLRGFFIHIDKGSEYADFPY